MSKWRLIYIPMALLALVSRELWTIQHDPLISQATKQQFFIAALFIWCAVFLMVLLLPTESEEI